MAQTPEFRKCRSCGRVLPIGQFGINPRCRGGHEPRCIECKTGGRAYTKSAADISLNSFSHEILDSLSDEILVEQLRKRGFRGELQKTHLVTI